MNYCLWLVGSEDIAEPEFALIKTKITSTGIGWSDDNRADFRAGRCAYKLVTSLEQQDVKEQVRVSLEGLALDGFVIPWEQRMLKPELIIMDMDSTLVQAETIDQIAKHAGVMDKVSEITEAAMRGELDFKASLKRRVSMLEGLTRDQLEPVHQSLPLTNGARELIQAARKNNCMTVLVSGGFNYFAAPIVKDLGIDEYYANELEFENEVLTGKVVGTIVDAEFKQDTLNRLISEHGFSRANTIAVGDGANDLLMLGDAGLGIAFHGKPKVQHEAQAVINHLGLDAIQLLLGW